MLKQKIVRTLTGAIGAVMVSTTVHAVLSKNPYPEVMVVQVE